MYAVRPGTNCSVCKHEQLTYVAEKTRYDGPWKSYKTTRSLSFGKPVLSRKDTFYFVDGEWMLRVKLNKGEQPSKTGAGERRVPDIKIRKTRDYLPVIRYRRDSEKT